MKKLFYFTNPVPVNFTEHNLSVSRRERYNLLAADRDKRMFLASEELTTGILSRCYGLKNPIIEGSAGIKPFVKDSAVQFSRSYSCNDIIIATDDCGINGVDAEIIRKADESLMNYFFTKKESEYVNKSHNRDFAFTLIWTRKESYIKCSGEGLKFEFNKLNVTPDSSLLNGYKLFTLNQKIGDFFLNSYYIGNTVISLCSAYDEVFPEIRIRG